MEGCFSEDIDNEDDYFDAEARIITVDGDSKEPTNYQEARLNDDRKFWKDEMGDEMESLLKNHTWTVVKGPEGQCVIGCCWIFNYKYGIPGVEPPRFKVRLVAKGYAQREGGDYTDIFSPVIRHVSIRILLSVVVEEDLKLEQLDVKTAFLHGDLDETIYMEAPEGFEDQFKPDEVYLLKKSMYLKQAPRNWNEKFDGYMTEMGFEKSLTNSCVYIKHT